MVSSRTTASASPAGVDEACVSGCLAGRPDAIEHLYRTYRTTVHGLLGRLVGPTPDLEDLVQTTFMHALARLHRFRGEASLGTWIGGIAVHVAQHHLRAGRVRRHVPLELVPEGEPPLTIARSGEEQGIDSRRLAARLHALLDRIHPRKRIALLLYVIEGRSVEEIGALMNATKTATKSRLFFARRELRALVRKDPGLLEWAAGLLPRAVGGEP
jgi:RNA polymerase sigma-70 factor (ECF subfamily)